VVFRQSGGASQCAIGREACAGSPDPAAAWYALRTRAKQEFIARDLLAASGIPEFLPYWTRLSRWADNRRREIRCALFPGYIFARFNAARDLKRVLALSGIVQVIGFGARAEPVPDHLIDDLIRATADPSRVAPVEWAAIYERGERVTITRGPLAGISGIVECARGRAHLIITIPMLGQACAVTIPASDIIGARRPRAKVA
jgi:transcription antitermination factor NusG